jgi:hypothetical protein
MTDAALWAGEVMHREQCADVMPCRCGATAIVEIIHQGAGIVYCCCLTCGCRGPYSWTVGVLPVRKWNRVMGDLQDLWWRHQVVNPQYREQAPPAEGAEGR